VRLLVRDLNKLYTPSPCSVKTISIRTASAGSIAAMRMRTSSRFCVLMQRRQALFAVGRHFGGAARDYRIGVPRQGYWREMINTNSSFYGGSGVGKRWRPQHRGSGRGDGFGQSILVTFPPHTTVIFKWSA